MQPFARLVSIVVPSAPFRALRAWLFSRRRPTWLARGALGACLLLFPVHHALADGGELSLRFEVDQEALLARTPALPQSDAPSLRAQPLYVARFGGALQYGLSNRLHLALVARASIPATATAPYTVYGVWHRGTASLTTRDAQLGVRLQATLHDGTLSFVDVFAEPGVRWRRWQLLGHETQAGHYAPVPSNASTPWLRGKALWTPAASLRVGATWRLRPWQHVAFALTPYYAYARVHEHAFGGTLAIEFPMAIGPSF